METDIHSLSTFEKALTLGEFWHNIKESLPENLRDRIQFALNLSNRELSEENRKTIVSLIKALLDHDLSKFTDQEDFQELLAQFETGEKTLMNLLEYELNMVETAQPDAAIRVKIAEINDLVYNVLKGFLDGDMKADALTSLDLVIDETRNEEFETSVTAILKQVEENLHGLANFKEVRLTHINPDPDIEEHTVHALSQTDSDISEHTNLNLFEWQTYKDKKLEVDWVTIQYPEDNEMRLIFKLSFGDQEFGYLEYRFEGEKIHPLVFGRCANMSAMIDTFLNARLQTEVKKLIGRKKREILADNNFKDWTVMCTELCKVLSKVLNKPIAFSCNLKPGETKSWDILIDGDNTEEDADFIGFTAQAMQKGGEFFEVKIDQGKGRQRIGSIMVACEDDAQRGIVNDVLSFLEGIVMGREEARHWLSKLIGAPSADMWLNNDIELTPSPHPVVVLYSDIDDYSKTVRELAQNNPDAAGGIDEIMNRFIAEAKLQTEKKYGVVVDKFVGDEVIVLIGPPYTEDGLDNFGHEEPNFAYNIDLAYEISEELQSILDRISEEVQKEYNFKLPHRLVFANGCGIVEGDPVGIYGAPEKPGAGVDYTIFGNEMNKVARVLGKSDANQFLIPYDTYIKYLEHGGENLKPIGEKSIIETKGVGKFEVILVEKDRTKS